MIDKRPDPQAEEPRSEPEIIPPDDAHVTRRMRIDTGTGRIYVAKISPLGADHRFPIGTNAGSALGRVTRLAACRRADRYRCARRGSIAWLFSTQALRPMPRLGEIAVAVRA